MVAKFIPTGRRRWYIIVEPSVFGREIRFSTGTTSERTAERIRAKTEIEIAEGRYLDRKRRSTWTLKQLGERYLPHMEIQKPRSDAWRRDRWAQIVKVLGDTTPLESIDTALVDDYVAERLKTVSLRTVKEDVAVLRHALGLASGPWQGITGLSEYRLARWRAPEDPGPPTKPQPVDPKDWARILAAARQRADRGRWADEHGLTVLLLARTLGARRGEVLGLRREDVNLETGVVRYHVLKKRAPEEQEAQVSGDVLRWLRRVALSHEHELLFANPETGVRRKDIKAFWTAVRKDAKARDRFHAIRHSYARDALARGASLRQLQGELGHSSIRTTEKYAHLVKTRKPRKGIPIE